MTVLSSEEEGTLETYRNYAPKWASGAYHDAYWLDWISVMKQFLKPGSSVIEFGCGSGVHTRELIEAGYRYLGTDAVPEMLTEARNANPGAAFQLANVYDTGLPSGSWDGFWAAALILHLKQPARALAEIRRLLRAPGVGFFSVREGEGEEIRVELDGDQRVERYFHWFTEAEFRTLLAASGFEIIGFKRRRDTDPTRVKEGTVWLEFLVRLVP
jgi:SAM-dependent methyltransferase